MAGEIAAQFDIHEAKKHLSCLVDRVQDGEEIIVTRGGTPVAKMIPLSLAARREGRGSLRSELVLAED
jgi:prevent-host-death family protein